MRPRLRPRRRMDAERARVDKAAIGRLSVRDAKIKKLSVGELEIERLRVRHSAR